MSPGIAVFGSGPLARLLIDEFRLRDMKIEAVWECDTESAKCFAAEMDVDAWSNEIDKILLLPGVQLVAIACVPHFHNQIFSKACVIGKHVICSLPPSESMVDIEQMQIAASNYSALITLFLSPLRFLPSIQLMRRLLQRDKFIGSVQSICAVVNCDVQSLCQDKTVIWDKFMGGGLLALFGSNLIDAITFVTGLSVQKVLGIMKSFGTATDSVIPRNNGDDFVTFQMELVPSNTQSFDSTNGSTNATFNGSQRAKPNYNSRPDEFSVASVTLNGLHYDHRLTHDLIIYGTKGYLAFRDGNLYGKLKEDIPGTPLVNGGHTVDRVSKESVFYLQEFNDSRPSKHHTQSATLPRLYQEGITEMIDAVARAFSSNTPDSIEEQSGQNSADWSKKPVEDAANLSDATDLQRVIDGIRCSAQSHQWIRVSGD